MLCSDLMDPEQYSCEILTGPETGSEGELHSECRRRGVQVTIEPSLVRRVSPVLDATAVARLVRHIGRGQYDIVHTHSSKAGIVGRLAARIVGTPTVVHTVHGWGFNTRQPSHESGTYALLERMWAPLCDALVVVASADRDEGLSRHIGRSEQYHLIRSGIELDVYRPGPTSREDARRCIGVPPDAFVMGTVGRLSPQKAPFDLLDAFAQAARTRPLAHLVFVGDGPLRSEVEQRIANLGLASRVHLLGLRADVPRLLPAFDVFALASHWEGLPRVFPQAMACGLPIVATRVAGAPDAVEHGVNGLLVNVGDIPAIAGALGALMDDPACARAMGERGRAKVGQFSARQMVEDLRALYDELTQRPAAVRFRGR